MKGHIAARLLACVLAVQPLALQTAGLGGATAAEPMAQRVAVVGLLAALLSIVAVTTLVYGIRHTLFALSRLMGRQRHPYMDIGTAEWPRITVFIAAHNEEKVIAGCIEALLATDYPPDRLTIVPVNDRSSDGTRAIIDRYVADHADLIVPFHRTSGKPGKAAAVKDALALARGDLVIVFDADYLPGKDLPRRLVASFFDPEVGAVMGRVVPVNAGTNLLTRQRRVRLLPWNLLCFVVSLFTITRALWDSVLDGVLRRELVWHKTLRYRST